MAAAGGVAGNAVLERKPRRQHRSAHRGQAATHHRFLQRQADAPHAGRVQAAAAHALHVARRMRELEPGSLRRYGLVHLLRFHQRRLQQQLEQPAELGHGEAVARRERRAVMGVIDERDAHVSVFPSVFIFRIKNYRPAPLPSAA